jgi:hypothetical protein
MDDFEKNRLIAVVGLIRTGFLKRFESSIVAFELSCIRLLQKLLAFVEVHSETDSEKRALHRWQTLNHSMMQHIKNYKHDFDAADEDIDEDFVSDDIIENTTRYSRDEYAVDAMLNTPSTISMYWWHSCVRPCNTMSGVMTRSIP